MKKATSLVLFLTLVTTAYALDTKSLVKSKVEALDICSKAQSQFDTRAIQYFALTAMNASFNYNFINYRQIIQSNNIYYTKGAWSSYLKTAANSDMIKLVRKRKLVINSFVKTLPKVKKTADSWQVSLPLYLVLQSASQRKVERRVLGIDIVKSNKRNGFCGLAIKNLKRLDKPSSSSWWHLNLFGSDYPYKETILVNRAGLSDAMILAQVEMKLINESVIAADTEGVSAPVIMRKGLVNGRYAWEVLASAGGKSLKVLVYRDANKPFGVSINIDKKEKINFRDDHL